MHLKCELFSLLTARGGVSGIDTSLHSFCTGDHTVIHIGPRARLEHPMCSVAILAQSHFYRHCFSVASYRELFCVQRHTGQITDHETSAKHDNTPFACVLSDVRIAIGVER